MINYYESTRIYYIFIQFKHQKLYSKDQCSLVCAIQATYDKEPTLSFAQSRFFCRQDKEHKSWQRRTEASNSCITWQKTRDHTHSYTAPSGDSRQAYEPKIIDFLRLV